MAVGGVIVGEVTVNRSKTERDKLALDHMHLVDICARKFGRWALDQDDLRGEAMEALLRAADGYDEERGIPFNAYAYVAIKNTLSIFVARNFRSVALPKYTGAVLRQASKIEADARRAAAEAGRTITPEEVDELCASGVHFTMSVDQLRRLRQAMRARDASLDEPLTPSAAVTRGDMLADTSPTPEQTVRLSIDGRKVRAAVDRHLAAIPARDRDILLARFLAEDGETLDEVGARHGITKERVRQVEKRATIRLQRAMRREFAPAVLA